MQLFSLRSDNYQLELKPLQWEHYPDLLNICEHDGLGAVLYNSVPYAHELKTYIENAFKQQNEGSRIVFAVVDLNTQKTVGTTSFYEIKTEIPRLEIGFTWYAKAYQKTFVNRVCKYLLLQHAFEHMNMKAAGFRTDHLNTASQKAIEGLGAKLDGVIRCHMLRKDGKTIRDSYVYSILQSEWQEVKPMLEAKLLKYSKQTHFEI